MSWMLRRHPRRVCVGSWAFDVRRGIPPPPPALFAAELPPFPPSRPAPPLPPPPMAASRCPATPCFTHNDTVKRLKFPTWNTWPKFTALATEWRPSKESACIGRDEGRQLAAAAA